MEYNTQRTQLNVREYGRHVQTLVERICRIENEEKQLEVAFSVVEILKTVNLQYKTSENSDQKIWDMLYYISDFRLNVKGPYPPPSKDNFDFHPQSLGYTNALPTERKHLGKNLLAFIKIAENTANKKSQDYLIKLIAHYMRVAYTTWHGELPSDTSIKNEIATLSGGKLVYHIEEGQDNRLYYSIITNQNTASRRSGNQKKNGNHRRKNGKKFSR